MDSVEEMRLVDTVDVLNWFTVLEINFYRKRRGVLIFGLEKSLIRFSFARISSVYSSGGNVPIFLSQGSIRISYTV